jgi:DNA-binding CsgD family transcriptional regulator
LADFIGARSVAIYDDSNDGADAIQNIACSSSRFSRNAMYEYSALHGQQEAIDRGFAQAIASKHAEIEVFSDEVTYDDYTEYLSRPNIISLRERGFRHRAMAFLSKDNLTRAHFTMQFSDDRGPINDAEKQRVLAIVPHLAKAYELGSLLAQDQRVPTADMVFENQTAGICIIDARLNILFKNEVFRNHLESADVMRENAFSQLEFLRETNQVVLNTAVESLRYHGQFHGRPRKGAIYAFRELGLCVEITPLVDENSEEISKFLITSRIADQVAEFRYRNLAKQFALTPVETEVLNLIVSGYTPTEISDIRNTAVSTTNNQIKSMLSKTHSRNKLELVRLAMIFR